MRRIRLRLRSSILLILVVLTTFFLVTLYTLVYSTNELERNSFNIEIVKPPDSITFWSAIDHQNIYDLHKPVINANVPKRAEISSTRIEELYQLIRAARREATRSDRFEKRYPIDPLWNFEKLVEQQKTHDTDETNKQNPDTAELAKTNRTETATKPISSTINSVFKPINDFDKRQLRHYVYRAVNKWRKEHRKDKIITIANVMHDELLQEEPSRLNTTWYQYMKTVTNLRVYDPNSIELKTLFNYLQKGEVIEASEMSQGTQIKIIFDLPGGFEALFKPYRVPRNYQTLPDHFYFSDVERHHAEIAAFHLDRILGFNRVPPVIGRFIDITRDIRDIATDDLARTFFISPANNTCFRGHCSYYCDTSHAVCGKPGNHLEGSVQVLLPRPPEADWEKITHPYRRSYSAVKKAKWESNGDYCYNRVFTDEDFHNRLLLDMMDLSAFDFLIGNMDRHHMMRISSFGANTALIHLDNGRSFGRYDFDDLTILTPIDQCCLFRYSTFIKLYQVYREGLSKLMAKSLETGEQLKTILIDEHLVALDRRLEILFAHIDACIKKYSIKDVMLDDGIE